MLHLNALNGRDHKLRGFFLQAQYPSILSRARGQGTFCAIDACDDATRDRIMLKARDKGIKHMVFLFFMMAPLVQFCTHGDHGRQVYDICKTRQ